MDGERVHKPGLRVRPDSSVEIRGPVNPYVSRGGLKLDPTLEAMGICVGGRRCLDVGSATGGFTQVLLKRGAASVTAVDVGRGQLAPALRADPRVTLLEQTDIRDLDPTEAGAPFSLATIDVSFIPLRLVLPAVVAHLVAGAEVVALVKPQFEAGPKAVGKKGLINDPAVAAAAVEAVVQYARDLFEVRMRMPSPILGRQGNQEFFLHLLRKDEGGSPDDEA